MHNDSIILEKIANLNENMMDDFYALNKKIDEHIKKTDNKQDKQDDFNKDISGKFHFFRGIVVTSFCCLATIVGLLIYIYTSDRKISDTNDANIFQQIRTISDEIMTLKYQRIHR